MLKCISMLFAIILMLSISAHAYAQGITADDGASIDERLAKEVTDQGVSLDITEKTVIIAKCSYSQSALEEVQLKSNRAIRLRTDTYQNIQNDLQAVKLRMIRQGADSSESDLLTGKIQQNLDQFTIQAAKYGTTLNDVIVVNCQQHPDQFKAGLTVMREERAKLLEYASKLNKLIKDSKENTFEPLKRRLSI